MNKNTRILIAGYKGLVGSAICRKLVAEGFRNILPLGRDTLDLTRQQLVEEYFSAHRPEIVFLAAAKVGGIWANKNFPADFIYSNLAIQTNVIHSSYVYGVKKMIFLGSSCIYPKNAPQPIQENSLLSSPLEPTNEAYAVAKIAGLKMCRYYNEQFGTNFLSVMPTNLYGPGDNYDLVNSHVFPAMIRKFHLASCLERRDWEGIRLDLNRNPVGEVNGRASEKEIVDLLSRYGITRVANQVNMTLWGTGAPRREFLFIDDLADSLLFLCRKCDFSDIGETINIGIGRDLSIAELAELIRREIGFSGKIIWDSTKPDGTPRKLLSVKRINDLGWTAKVTLKEGLALTLKAYRKGG